MVSELAGEGAMPLPEPASHVELRRIRLQRQIHRGSLLRRGVTTMKSNNASRVNFSPASFDLWRIFKVAESFLQKRAGPGTAVDGGGLLIVKASKPDSLRAIDSLNSLFLQINKDWSAVLFFQSSISRSRFVKLLSKVLTSHFFANFNRSRSVKFLSAMLVNPLFEGSRSRSAKSTTSAELVVAVSLPQRRTMKKLRTSTALVVDLVSVGRSPAIPIQSSAMVSRSQSVNFGVVVSTQLSNVHFNSNSKKASEWPRKSSRSRIGESADLCDRCASVHKECKFCEIFHLNVSGWRSCEYCGKQIHCECILSFHTIVLLNAGGIECIICSRKSCFLTPNLAWPPPYDFLPLQAEGIKDSRSWNPIAGSSPVPSREVHCLNSPFIGQQLQASVIKSSLILDFLVGCSDLDMYSKMSIKEIADNVFEEIPNRNIGTWNACISNAVINGRHNDAVKRMQLHGNVIRVFDSMDDRNGTSWCSPLVVYEQNYLREENNEIDVVAEALHKCGKMSSDLKRELYGSAPSCSHCLFNHHIIHFITGGFEAGVSKRWTDQRACFHP